MEFITWDSSLVTGISLIDGQHRVLVNKLNKLYANIEEKRATNDLNILLDELLEYTYYHFETEENFFNEFAYAEKEQHLKEHDEFRKYLNDILLKKDKNEVLLSKDLLNYLKQWIDHHIKEVDMEYVEFLKNKI